MGGADLVGAIVAAALGIGLSSSALSAAAAHTSIDDGGNVVPPDLQALIDKAGLASLDELALARVAASEAGGQRQIAKAGVCWVVLNVASRGGKSVADVVLGSASTFGHQGTGGRNFVSSAADPAPVDKDVARGVLGGAIPDPTGGAVNFDSPRAYEDPARADLFASNRRSEGKELVTLDGVSPTTFRFWRYS